MTKILISRCLLGIPCRYDALSKPSILPELNRLGISRKALIDVCPETDGGLPNPRLPCEIEPNHDGADVVKSLAKVVDATGNDKTAFFLKGANIALEKVLKENIHYAVLKAKSPSCGIDTIYDGTFCGRLKAGQGVCTALLTEAGVTCFTEHELVKLCLAIKGNSLK